MNWKIILTTVLGCLFIIMGVVLPLVFPTIFEAKLAKKLVIAPNSEMLKSFEKTPIPIYFEVYFFNITNPDDMYYGETPILTQHGPYTYRQERYKHNITWNHDLGTVSYNEQKLYFFEADKSVGSEDDEFTTLNPVFVTIAAKVNDLNVIIRSAISLFTWEYESFQLFMTKKVKELAFSGYADPVISKLYDLSQKEKYASGKTGFLYPKNGTIAPVSEVYSGELGMENYQNVYKYKGQTKLDYWGRDDCNMINGTFGSQFAKPISKTDPLYMFSVDLCRSIYVSYEKDTKLGPLTLHRFSLTKDVLDMSDANACYCSDNFTCRGSMVSIAKCREGAPIVMSTPHFYMGREEDITMVDGLNPLKNDHETFLEIEPNTGVTMRASKKMQVNIALKRYTAFSDFADLKEVILPILWVNENVEVPLARAEALHENLTSPKTMVGYLALILVGVGVLLVIVALVTLCCGKRKEMKMKEREERMDMTVNKKLLHGQIVEKMKY